MNVFGMFLEMLNEYILSVSKLFLNIFVLNVLNSVAKYKKQKCVLSTFMCHVAMLLLFNGIVYIFSTVF